MSKAGIVFYAPSQLNSFAKSNVLKKLKENYDLRIFSTRIPIADSLEKDYREIVELITIPEMVRKVSGFVQMVSLWRFRDRSMNHLVRAMASFGTKKEQDSWKCVVVSEMKISYWKRLTVRFASLTLVFVCLRLLERLLLEFFAAKKFKLYFKGVRALLLPFSGHIGADFGNLVWVARRLSIPVIGLQENWDNLATKTFILEEPDYFLVWGDQSAGHIRSVHRLFDVKVSVVGSPRFSPYFQDRRAIPAVSTESGKRVDLRDRQFILVAGTGDGIDDVMLVRLVANAFSPKVRKRISANLTIVYRPHPMTRTAVDYTTLLHEFPSMLIDAGPESRSFGHHNALVKSAALVINHFSTLTVESLLCGTPVMVPLFLGRSEARYRYEHILNEWHHMMGVGLISRIKTPRTPEEFTEHLIEALQEDASEVGPDINLDWICKKSDYVEEVSRFINLNL